jgi:hypothetical protein
VLAQITDTNPLATAADLTATVNWGDGGATEPASIVLVGGTATTSVFNVIGSHTYAEETPVGTGDAVTLTVTTTGGVAATFTPAPPVRR